MGLVLGALSLVFSAPTIFGLSVSIALGAASFVGAAFLLR